MRDFHIGTIMGIPIRVNISLLLFLPVLAWLIAAGGQIEVYAQFIAGLWPHALDVAALKAGSTPWIIGFAGGIGLFASVLLHELGHSWMARRYRIGIVSITLWIFGGMARMEEIPEEWHKEFWIALAGPAVSLALGVAGIGLLQVVPPSVPTLAFVVGFLGIVNVTLVVFNMLPAFPMDGGRVLRALLARSRPYASATKTAATVGKGMAVLMAIVGLLGNPLLILIALFVYMAASQESRATVIRDLLRGVVVRDLISSEIRTVDADSTIASLVERIMLERHSGYPVVEDGRLAGVVTITDVKRVREVERDAVTVREVMETDPAVVHPDADAFEALQRFGDTDGPLIVAENGTLLGIVTQEDLVRALEIIQGLRPKESRDLAHEGFA